MQNSFDFIDDYISRRLSPEENTAFEKNLHTDTALMSAVENQKRLLANLKRLRLKQLITEATVDMPTPKSPSYRWLVIGSAITIFSIILGYFIWKNDDIPLNAPLEKIETKPIENVKHDEPRADTKIEVSPVEKASAPTEKEAKIVSVLPQKQENQLFGLDSISYAIVDAPIGFDNWNEKNEMLRGEAEEQAYFEAYKNLKNGVTEKAIAGFKLLVVNKQFRNYRRAEWYLTLGQLAQNPSSKNEMLNTIINTQGHYFQQKAKALKLYLQRNNR
jgi:hypothetical protein